MLSYQHGFHAGNRADVLKHAILDAILTELAASGKHLLYIETHSGRGRYDLTSRDAKKTGEARQGVGAFVKGKIPRALRPWMDLVNAEGKTRYPGSPALAAHHLPDMARMILFEKHPAEYAALTEAMGNDKRIQIKRTDGYSAALKLAPRRSETLCIFVDPSYETEHDMDALAAWAPRALKRWPHAVIILWLPLFKDEREADFGAYLASLEDGVVAGARWPVSANDESALEGSAMVAYRAPEAAQQKATAIASTLQSFWSGQAS